MEYRIGDVIEFKVASFHNGGCEVSVTERWVGRIDSVIRNLGERKNTDHEVELWLEYLCEVNSCMYVAPEHVVRIIERGPIDMHPVPEPPLPIGTLVIVEDDKKSSLDEISGFEFFDNGAKQGWQFKMKYSGYQMDRDEFKLRGEA